MQISLRTNFCHPGKLLKLIKEPYGIEKRKVDTRNEIASAIDDMAGCLSKGSIIVYVWRKKDAEIVTEQLCGLGLPGGIVCYHGGMDSSARSKAQEKVCSSIITK